MSKKGSQARDISLRHRARLRPVERKTLYQKYHHDTHELLQNFRTILLAADCITTTEGSPRC